MKRTIRVTRDDNGVLQPSKFVTESTPIAYGHALINERGPKARERRRARKEGLK